MSRADRSINMGEFIQFIRTPHMHLLLQGEWIGIAEAAERLHYSTNNIRKLIKNKKLNAIFIPNIGFAINAASLQLFATTRGSHEQTA